MQSTPDKLNFPKLLLKISNSNIMFINEELSKVSNKVDLSPKIVAEKNIFTSNFWKELLALYNVLKFWIIEPQIEYCDHYLILKILNFVPVMLEALWMQII